MGTQPGPEHSPPPGGRTRRFLTLGLAVTVLVVVVAAAAGAVSAGRTAAPLREVKIPWRIVVEEAPAPTQGCSAVAFLQISEVKGGVSYAVTIVDSATGTYNLKGPPWPADATAIHDKVVRPPKGSHRWGLSSAGTSGTEGCGAIKAGFLNSKRWKVTKAVAYVRGTPEQEKRGSIRGRVVEVECGEKDCTERGLAGVVVSAVGKDGGKAMSGTNGSYSIDVAAGSYRVTPKLPGRQFDPPSRSVTVPPGGTAAAKFSTCAKPVATKSVEVVETAVVNQCDTFQIDWTMPDHIQTAGWDSAPEPSVAYIYPEDGWTVRLFLKTAKGTPFACRAGHTYTWRIAPRGSKNADVLSKKPCRLTHKVPREGVYTVTVEEQRTSDGEVTAKTTRNVVVQDFLLIGTGDSNGSGQANPPYWNRQCDRSVESYQMRTAEYVERQDPRTSVTFVHLACSGARTVHIADRPYAGQEPSEGETLQPQLVSLRQALNKGGKRLREIDAMIMSIGINDLRFGGILHVCLGNAKFRVTDTTPCQDLPVVRAADKVGEPTLNQAPSGSKGDGTLRAAVATEIARLPTRFATLKSRIAARVQIKPARIIATTYPDEAWRSKNVLCDETSGYIPRLLATEWQWLSEAGGELNKAVAAAFPSAVTSIPALFIGHGYCTPPAQNWFRSFSSSVIKQGNEFGTFHPTREGHIQMHLAVVGTICSQLYPGQTKTGNCSGMAREPG